MSETQKILEESQQALETALNNYEMQEKLEDTLSAYPQVESRLATIQLEKESSDYPRLQSVLAYCLMRKGNILRQVDRAAEAAELSQWEIAATRASGDKLTLARSLLSHGLVNFQQNQPEISRQYFEEARSLFEQGDSYDFQQGVGWCWILRADLMEVGYLPGRPTDRIEVTNRALDILLPLDNWPGIARAYAGRAGAHEAAGNTEAAQADRKSQASYEEITRLHGAGPKQDS